MTPISSSFSYVTTPEGQESALCPLNNLVLSKVSQHKREGMTGHFGDNQGWQGAAAGWRMRGLDENGQKGKSLQQRS